MTARWRNELPALSSELPITIRTPEHLLDAIDRFREELDDKPNRPEAIRRLLMKALSGTVRTQK
jgi:metal-responsive CopG/Arc/MetJ family transcriptional regulator